MNYSQDKHIIDKYIQQKRHGTQMGNAHPLHTRRQIDDKMKNKAINIY